MYILVLWIFRETSFTESLLEWPWRAIQFFFSLCPCNLLAGIKYYSGSCWRPRGSFTFSRKVQKRFPWDKRDINWVVPAGARGLHRCCSCGRSWTCMLLLLLTMALAVTPVCSCVERALGVLCLAVIHCYGRIFPLNVWIKWICPIFAGCLWLKSWVLAL